MDLFDEELLQLWTALEKNKVKYILIGGFATILNGGNRLTH